MTLTLHDIETALDAGSLWAAMRDGAYWRLRRNGKTRRWKTRPLEWAIPVKARLKSYTTLTQDSLIAAHGFDGWRDAHFIASPDRPH